MVSLRFLLNRKANQMKFADASVDQLREFAGLSGLDVEPGLSKAAIIQLLDEAGIEGEMPDPEPAKRGRPAKAATAKAIDPSSLVGKKLTVIVGDTLYGKETETVGLNGSLMLIKRGVKSEISFEMYEAMRTSIGMSYASTERGGKGAARPVPTFPMTVVGGDPECLAYLEQRES